MKGKPKVGEVWIAKSTEDDCEGIIWWYQIIALVKNGGRTWYIAIKGNGDGGVFTNIFDEQGRDQLGPGYPSYPEYCHYLTRRSRAKPFLEVVGEQGA
jgi:hypothetical protein